MKYMQRRFLKNILFVAGTIFLLHFSAFSQSSSFRLRQADSLFHAKQYTQSLELFQTMFEQHQYTPAMLLKMAFIEEGLGETGNALYHLNLYYIVSKDEAALQKMEDLAAKYNLTGYDRADLSWFFSLYHDYHTAITVGLGTLLFLLACLGIYLRTKGRRQIALAIIITLYGALLAVHINKGAQLNTAIVANPRTIAMTGPSAGAPVAGTLAAGHRVEVIGRNDVWLKILWQGRVLFVKDGSVLPVSL